MPVLRKLFLVGTFSLLSTLCFGQQVDEAHRIQANVLGVDSHNDTLQRVLIEGVDIGGRLLDGQVDIPRLNEVFRGCERICTVYPRLDADLVSCHMDLKPENILFDGRRVWLVDWTAAFLNDRYFDLAVFANFVVANEADETSHLSGLTSARWLVNTSWCDSS